MFQQLFFKLQQGIGLLISGVGEFERGMKRLMFYCLAFEVPKYKTRLLSIVLKPVRTILVLLFWIKKTF